MAELSSDKIAFLRDKHERFLYHLNRFDVIYGLRNADGFVTTNSSDGKSAVMLVWSDRDTAQGIADTKLKGSEVHEISLYDFMFSWIPGMRQDGVMLGINWSAEAAGLELTIDGIKAEIERTMDKRKMQRMVALHEERTNSKP